MPWLSGVRRTLALGAVMGRLFSTRGAGGSELTGGCVGAGWRHGLVSVAEVASAAFFVLPDYSTRVFHGAVVLAPRSAVDRRGRRPEEWANDDGDARVAVMWKALPPRCERTTLSGATFPNPSGPYQWPCVGRDLGNLQRWAVSFEWWTRLVLGRVSRKRGSALGLTDQGDGNTRLTAP